MLSAVACFPLERHRLFETRDPDEARDRVGKVFCAHQLSYAGRGRRLFARQNFAQFGHLALSYLAYGEEMIIDAGEIENCYFVRLIRSGSSEIRIGKYQFVGNSRIGSVSSAKLPLSMRWSPDCAHLALKIDRRALERHLSDLLGSAILRPVEFIPELPVDTGRGASYRRLIEFISNELDCDDALMASPLAVAGLEQMLMTSLLTMQPSNYSAALSARVSPAAPRHVHRAEEYIRAHADRPITIGQLAEVAGVHTRTLFEGFQRFRGITPFAMLKAVRLERVHAELKTAGTSGCVSDIALKWGFAHLGRFAQLYRRRFGELPSETLRR
ncbi:AraC family transcriptional regulator [Bradyrhizobium sp. B117]|uniref:AraC family transcriptional regulator n=1 Tax=Bradyrhizobium sp. B117 TaxID=3140246 RepID=UPI0031834D85